MAAAIPFHFDCVDEIMGPGAAVGEADGSDPYVWLVSRNQRHVNSLSDPDRSTRKRGLSALGDIMFARKARRAPSGGDLDEKVLKRFFVDHLAGPLVGLFGDPVEKCRELSLDMYSKSIDAGFLAEREHFAKAAAGVVRAAQSRLGAPTVVEPSEEIRLSIIAVIRKLVEHTGAECVVGSLLGDIVHVLAQGLRDKFPDCKCESAKCVLALAKVLPSDMHLHFTPLLNGIVGNMSHNRSKVRQLSLQAGGALAECGGEGLERAMKEHLIPLVVRTNEDRSAAVRKETVKVVSRWFESLPGIEQYEHALLPVLLSAVADPAIDLAKFSLLKLEATSESLSSADGRMDEEAASTPQERCELPEPFSTRPGPSVRSLVTRIMPRMLPFVLEETKAWTLDARIRAAKVLRTILVCAEDAATAHLPEILDALCKMFLDEEAAVRAVALECARVIGAYIAASASLPILFTRALGKAQGLGGDEHQAGALFVISSLVSGFGPDALASNVPDISRVLAHRDVRESDSALVQAQIIEVVDAILDAAEHFDEASVEMCRSECFGNVSVTTRNILVALLQLSGSPSYEDPEKMIPSLVDALAVLACSPSCENCVQTMLREHAQGILSTVFAKIDAASGSGIIDITSCDQWTRSSAPRQLFDELVRVVGAHNLSVSGQMSLVIDVAKRTLNIDRDAELRMLMLALLDTLLTEGASSPEFRASVDAHVPSLIMDVLRPNLTWRVGRVAGTIRKVSMFCFQSLLGTVDASGFFAHAESLTPEWVVSTLWPNFIPSLKSCLDDHEPDTKRFTCGALERVFLLLKAPRSVSDAAVQDIYPDLVKRLDDSNDNVRKSACATMRAFIDCIAPGGLHTTAFDYTADALFIHLDDPDPEVQTLVLGILKAMMFFNAARIAAKAKKNRLTHRSPDMCDALAKLCVDAS